MVDTTISHVVYSKFNARAPKAASRAAQTKLTTMPNTGAMMCIMGRSMLDQLKMDRSKLVKVTEQLVAANGDQIALNGAVFLCLARGGKKTTQMVYVLAQVKHMLLSQTACKCLGLVDKGFLNAAMQPEVAECTATEHDKDDGRGCGCPTRIEAPLMRRSDLVGIITLAGRPKTTSCFAQQHLHPAGQLPFNYRAYGPSCSMHPRYLYCPFRLALCYM